MAREMAQKKIQQGALNRNTFSVPGTSMETSISTMVKEKPGANDALFDLIQKTKPGTYAKNPVKTMPSSYYNPSTKPRHTRNPSAGNSPLTGSDDGLGSNHLSPQSHAGFSTNHQPVHKKQLSAPNILTHTDNMGMYDQLRQPVHQQHQPVHHNLSHSTSALPPQGQFTTPFHHRQARSQEAFSNSYGGNSLHPEPHTSNIGETKELSRSLPPAGFMQESIKPPDEDRLGPLPPNWEYRLDEASGNGYYVDHNAKTTTWFDPRIPQNPQHNEIPRAYPGGAYYQQQHEGQHFPVQNQDFNALTYQRVQQLENERSSLQERQAQLLQSGLLQPDNSPRQFTTHSPMNMGHDYPQYQSGNPYVGHNRTMSTDSGAVIDSGMEVDYSHGVMHEPYNGIADINPHEFDRYLHLGDNKPQHTHPPQQQRIHPFQ